jgi:hypothetical protein
MDRLKGEPGSGRREVQQKKAPVSNPSISTTRLIWKALEHALRIKSLLDSYNQEQVDAIQVVLGFLQTEFRTHLSTKLPERLLPTENHPCSKNRGSVYLIDGKQ